MSGEIFAVNELEHMGIINTIIRSRDDSLKPKTKSYWGYKLNIQLVNKEEITEKIKLLPSEKRLVLHELSGKEPVEQVILLSNSKKELGRLTTNQVKEILDDMGFNVDTILAGMHGADYNAVMNINGFLIPGWHWVARAISKLFYGSSKLWTTKLSPGKERLHVRMFEMNDGTWLIAAHTDVNWMDLNLAKVFKAHLTTGAGDFKTGTLMMYELLKKFAQYLNENQNFPYEEIVGVTRWAYYHSLAEKYKPRSIIKS